MADGDSFSHDHHRADQPQRSVIAAFVAGHESASGDWRSICGTHDTAGRTFMLLHDDWPLAVRWEDAPGVRVDVHHGAAPTTKALIEINCRESGARHR